MDIPCGNCQGCRLDRSAEWTSRLVHESKSHIFKSFLTLTYDDDKIPEGGTLVKKHMQDFLKRLRRNTGVKIRFFACGEYGDKTFRPHYHALIFGYDFPDKTFYKTAVGQTKLYISKELDKLWGHGLCSIGTVTPESCSYVARYVMKKITGQMADDHYRRFNPETGETWTLLPEYIHMSTKPAIGKAFYDQYKDEIHESDSVIVKSRERKVPRYYDKQLEKEDPARLEWLKYTRAQLAKKGSKDQTPERLAVREECLKHKTRTLARTL